MVESTTGGQTIGEMLPEQKLHDLRKKIDANIQYAQSLGNDSRKEYQQFFREISLVITRLQEGKMWAGKCLEALGSPFPKEFQDKAE